MRHRTSTRGHLARALMLVLSAAALGACGDSGSTDDATASSQAGREQQERARLRLSACLRKQGVDVPEGPSRDGQAEQRPSQADLRKVREALEGPCKKYQRQAFGNLSEEDRAEMRDRMVKFASCMRKYGVDLPDPGEGPRVMRLDRDDPKVAKATEACRELLPARGRGGGGVIGPGPPPGR